jgi:hypothetical protein
VVGSGIAFFLFKDKLGDLTGLAKGPDPDTNRDKTDHGGRQTKETGKEPPKSTEKGPTGTKDKDSPKGKDKDDSPKGKDKGPDAPKGDDKDKKPPVVNPQPVVTGPQLAADVAARLKKSTVSLRVDRADGQPGNGSGFCAIEPGIILTTAALLGMDKPDAPKPTKIEVIFDPALATERMLFGHVIAADSRTGLAFIEVDVAAADQAPLPPPLPLLAADGLGDKANVFVAGMPADEAKGRATGLVIDFNQVAAVVKDREANNTVSRIELTNGVAPGQVGGPLAVASGGVLGVVQEGGGEGQKVIVRPVAPAVVLLNALRTPLVLGPAHAVANAPRGRSSSLATLALLGPIRGVDPVIIFSYQDAPDAKPRNAPGSDGSKAASTGQGRVLQGSGSRAPQGEVSIGAINVPKGKVEWLQPVFSSPSGYSLWGMPVAVPEMVFTDGSPFQFPPRMMVPTPFKVEVSATARLHLRAADGQEHWFVDRLDAVMLEKADIKGVAQGKFGIQILKVSHSQTLDHQRTALGDQIAKVLPELAKVSFEMQMDRGGAVTHKKTDLARVPAESREVVEKVADQALNTLLALAVTTPSQQFKLDEIWSGTQPAALPLPGGVATCSLKTNYAFKGTSGKDRVENAIVSVVPALVTDKEKGTSTAAGIGFGSAVYEFGSGIISQAHFVTDLGTEVPFQGKPAKLDGTLEISVRRKANLGN